MKLRLARRSWEAHQLKELPRSIRRLQSPPFVHAARSRGAPTQFQFGCRQSATHSDTLPDMVGQSPSIARERPDERRPIVVPATAAALAIRTVTADLRAPAVRCRGSRPGCVLPLGLAYQETSSNRRDTKGHGEGQDFGRRSTETRASCAPKHDPRRPDTPWSPGGSRRPWSAYRPWADGASAHGAPDPRSGRVPRRARRRMAKRGRASRAAEEPAHGVPRARPRRTRQAPGLAGVAAGLEAWPTWSGARAATRCRCLCADPPRWTVRRPASAAGTGQTQRSGFRVALTCGTLSKTRTSRRCRPTACTSCLSGPTTLPRCGRRPRVQPTLFVVAAPCHEQQRQEYGWAERIGFTTAGVQSTYRRSPRPVPRSG